MRLLRRRRAPAAAASATAGPAVGVIVVVVDDAVNGVELVEDREMLLHVGCQNQLNDLIWREG